jgi:hypothetical protein
MKRKWDDQDKVGTLQIAIQATKLLHDTEKAVTDSFYSEIPCSEVCIRDRYCRAIWHIRLRKNKESKLPSFS